MCIRDSPRICGRCRLLVPLGLTVVCRGLSNNRLTGGVPEVFGGMTDLTDLLLSNNWLSAWSAEEDEQVLTICDILDTPDKSPAAVFGKLNDCDISGNPLQCEIPTKDGCAAHCAVTTCVKAEDVL
eukprot:TRINITY_DN641_c0_g1_i3.p2 TRINITY_DN641_c0_g1~~TRINITY_DN641_c0_g1_i3.p2  ORF type:complete len:126 (+),score=21.76 TRINITY_DN641_c0_g1_i3:88-465(+)